MKFEENYKMPARNKRMSVRNRVAPQILHDELCRLAQYTYTVGIGQCEDIMCKVVTVLYKYDREQ